MGAPGAGMKAADQPTAESLLTAFKTLSAAERRRHATVLNYWLSVRGDKEFPPLHDLDPLELSDAGPNSILMELISGGHDAEIRHLGEALRDEAWPERIIDAPNPSVLSCIAKKLPIVAISRDFLAFEDEYETAGAKTRCSITLLPLSAGGAWVDYVYALVSTDTAGAKTAKEAAKKTKPPESDNETAIDESTEIEQTDDVVADQSPEQTVDTQALEPADPVEQITDHSECSPELESVAEPFDETVEPCNSDVESKSEPELDSEPEPEPVPAAVAKAAPGFSKLLDSIAGLTGFYGSQPVKVEPVVAPPLDVAREPVEEPAVQEPVAEEPAPEDTAAQEPVADGSEQMQPTAETAVGEELTQPSVHEEPVFTEPSAVVANHPAPSALEGSLQNKLTQVRAKADEARMARLKATAALCEGLAAAYDFALDAEDAPEEYLRLVEAQGLKIQLRSPMKPVVKLAFAGMCDDSTIKQLEAVLAWAFDEELPRGTLAERIESAGGIGAVLGNGAKAA